MSGEFYQAKDDEVRGFLRTKHTARFWLAPFQLQVWRSREAYAFNASFHGLRHYFGISAEIPRKQPL